MTLTISQKRRLAYIRLYLINEAVKILGITSNPVYAVSILPDGRMVDGRWDKEHDRMRTVDHSDFPLTDADGVITILGTFQKTFSVDEFEDLLTKHFSYVEIISKRPLLAVVRKW